MPNPATVGDIEDRWRPLTPEEQVPASTFLADAWWLLTARRPTLEADMLAGTVTAGNVVRVVAGMALRLLRNPEGYSSESIGSYSYQRDDLVASGRLHVTDEELGAVIPSGYRRTRSVRLVAYGET